jgi:hypothetical protein
VLRDYVARRPNRARDPEKSPPTRHGLLPVRSAVIFAIATAGALIAGWSQPGFGLGAWLVLVIGLDAIINRD